MRACDEYPYNVTMETIKKFENINRTDTAIAGGKGASLGEMTQAGMPVPPGFVVTVEAFEEFLRDADLGVELGTALRDVRHEDINSVEEVSKKIRDLIHDADFPEALGDEIKKAYHELNAPLVAIRSSATAEDSSMASWAGELESYLNVTAETLLESVKKCWSSLFTPRAIFYRFDKNLQDSKISVAVIVQAMIQSEVSGICFTVHPITQDHDQIVIEAGWGLGEVIVGGMITPDAYVVHKKDWRILDQNVHEQEIMIVQSEIGNSEQSVPTEKREKQKLSDEQIIELAKLCQKIEEHYQYPQDIEWAFADSKMYIVQSRPITTLGL